MQTTKVVVSTIQKQQISTTENSKSSAADSENSKTRESISIYRSGNPNELRNIKKHVLLSSIEDKSIEADNLKAQVCKNNYEGSIPSINNYTIECRKMKFNFSFSFFLFLLGVCKRYKQSLSHQRATCSVCVCVCEHKIERNKERVREVSTRKENREVLVATKKAADTVQTPR